MGLDELVACIETIQQRIREHGDFLQKSETRTRMALIDPLLQVLGWDITDPGVVLAEYKVSGKFADYALLRSNGKPAAMLEAKKLGTELEAHRIQMLNYANAAGIPYAGLTEGNRWEIYKVFEQSKLEDRRVLDVSIEKMPAHESALKLLLMWRCNLTSNKPIPASKPLIVEPPPSLPPPPPPPPSSWVSLYDLNPKKGAACPSIVRFWDGEKQEIKYWNQLLYAVVKKLCSENRLAREHLPIHFKSSSKTYIVHYEPKHPTGKRFNNYKNIPGNDVFVNVNYSAVAIRQAALRVLEVCNQVPKDVQLLMGH